MSINLEKLRRMLPYKEAAGVIGAKATWVWVDAPYLYLANTLLGLFWEIVRGWKNDRNLVG